METNNYGYIVYDEHEREVFRSELIYTSPGDAEDYGYDYAKKLLMQSKTMNSITCKVTPQVHRPIQQSTDWLYDLYAKDHRYSS